MQLLSILEYKDGYKPLPTWLFILIMLLLLGAKFYFSRKKKELRARELQELKEKQEHSTNGEDEASV